MGLGEMPGACQGQDEPVKLRLQPVEASVDVGAQPGESANEHTERNREQDTERNREQDTNATVSKTPNATVSKTPTSAGSTGQL